MGSYSLSFHQHLTKDIRLLWCQNSNGWVTKGDLFCSKMLLRALCRTEGSGLERHTWCGKAQYCSLTPSPIPLQMSPSSLCPAELLWVEVAAASAFGKRTMRGLLGLWLVPPSLGDTSNKQQSLPSCLCVSLFIAVFSCNTRGQHCAFARCVVRAVLRLLGKDDFILQSSTEMGPDSETDNQDKMQQSRSQACCIQLCFSSGYCSLQSWWQHHPAHREA